MATNSRDKSGTATLAGKLAAGTAKHLGAGTQVLMLGSTFTPADITSKLTQIVTLRAAADAAKASSAGKVAAEKQQLPALRAFMSAYTAYVHTAFNSVPDVLADFGLTPKKAPAALSAEAQAAAVAKRNATRDARGTKGSKQKKAIKGDVAGITMTPVKTQIVVPVAPSTSGSTTGVGTPPAPAAGTAPKAAT
jgi:hypothetical protein